MLDAMIASTLIKLLDKPVHFRRRVSVEEQRAQNLRSSTRSIRFVQYTLTNDDVQDFDVRRDQAPLSASETRTEIVLEGLYM